MAAATDPRHYRIQKPLAQRMAANAARIATDCPTCKAGAGRQCIGSADVHGQRVLKGIGTGSLNAAYDAAMAQLGWPTKGGK